MANEKETKEQNISPAQMMEMMKEFAKELKKPSEEEQAKIDAEKARKEHNRQQMVEAAKIEMENRRNAQLNCGHKKDDGKHTFSGSTLSNGDAIAICQRCGAEYRWKATTDQIQNGLGLQSVSYITPQMLEGWEKQAPPKIKARRAELQLAALGAR